MNRLRILLILSLWLLAPSLAVAQAPDQPGRYRSVFEAKQAALGGAPDRQKQQVEMYEDIEILRRILLQKLGPVYHSKFSFHWADTLSATNYAGVYNNTKGRTFAFPDDGTANTLLFGEYFKLKQPVPPLDAEAVYLKGHGVVYTLTLPPPADPKPEAAKPAPKPLSDWERIRKELRGEKVEPTDSGPPSKEPSPTDIILKALAENGRHFAQLADNESLTVAITFREAGKPARNPSAVGSPDGLPGSEGGAPGSGRGESPEGAVLPGETGGTKAPSSVRDYELLGDLHLKQGNAQKAIDAYKKAVELNPEPKQAAVLYKKLAQAHLSQAHPDNEPSYDEVLKKALEWLVRSQEEAAKASKPSPTPSPLPAKLIISAPKKLLDQAGAGKISFEEFKKSATVEYVTFPATEKSPK